MNGFTYADVCAGINASLKASQNENRLNKKTTLINKNEIHLNNEIPGVLRLPVIFSGINSQPVTSSSSKMLAAPNNEVKTKKRKKNTDPVCLKINILDKPTLHRSASIAFQKKQPQRKDVELCNNKTEKRFSENKINDPIAVSKTISKSRTTLKKKIVQDREKRSFESAELGSEQNSRINLQPKSTKLEEILRPILSKLVSHNDAQYKNAIEKKVTPKKIVISGFHEIAKYLLQKNLKLLIIARDLEGHAGLYEKVKSYDEFSEIMEKYYFVGCDKIDEEAPLSRYGVPKAQSNVLDPVLDSIIKLKNARSSSLDEYVKMVFMVAKRLKIPVIFAFKRHQLRSIMHKSNLISAVGIVSIHDQQREFKSFLESMGELLPTPIYENLKSPSIDNELNDDPDSLTNLSRFFDELST